MSALASRVPAVQKHLFRMLSKELGSASLLAGDHSADERMAAFLLALAGRSAARGFSPTRFPPALHSAERRVGKWSVGPSRSRGPLNPQRQTNNKQLIAIHM